MEILNILELHIIYSFFKYSVKDNTLQLKQLTRMQKRI